MYRFTSTVAVALACCVAALALLLDVVSAAGPSLRLKSNNGSVVFGETGDTTLQHTAPQELTLTSVLKVTDAVATDVVRERTAGAGVTIQHDTVVDGSLTVNGGIVGGGGSAGRSSMFLSFSSNPSTPIAFAAPIQFNVKASGGPSPSIITFAHTGSFTGTVVAGATDRVIKFSASLMGQFVQRDNHYGEYKWVIDSVRTGVTGYLGFGSTSSHFTMQPVAMAFVPVAAGDTITWHLEFSSYTGAMPTALYFQGSWAMVEEM